MPYEVKLYHNHLRIFSQQQQQNLEKEDDIIRTLSFSKRIMSDDLLGIESKSQANQERFGNWDW